MWANTLWSNRIYHLFNNGQLDEMVDLLRRRIRYVRRVSGSTSRQVAFAIEDLALAFYELGDFSAAAFQLEKVQELERALIREPDESYARCLCNLGRMYLFCDRNAEAELLFNDAEHLFSRLPAKNRRGQSTLMINMAMLALKRGDYSKAETLAMEAMKLRLHDFGYNHPKYAVTLEHLSHVLSKQGRLRQSKQLIRKAIRIYFESSQTDTAVFAMMLAFLGDINAKQDNRAQAESHYSSALEILRRVRPEGHFQIERVERHVALL